MNRDLEEELVAWEDWLEKEGITLLSAAEKRKIRKLYKDAKEALGRRKVKNFELTERDEMQFTLDVSYKSMSNAVENMRAKGYNVFDFWENYVGMEKPGHPSSGRVYFECKKEKQISEGRWI